MRSTRTLSVLAAMAMVMLVVLFGGVATAQADEIRVQIRTIYAEHQDVPAMDAALTPLADELRAAFAAYNVFELIGTHDVAVPVGQSGSIQLPDKDSSVLDIGYKGKVESDPGLLRLSVGLQGKIAAEVKASPGSTFFQAGLIYRDGILVLAIRADRAKTAP